MKKKKGKKIEKYFFFPIFLFRGNWEKLLADNQNKG
jgi:hypothetical protein